MKRKRILDYFKSGVEEYGEYYIAPNGFIIYHYNIVDIGRFEIFRNELFREWLTSVDVTTGFNSYIEYEFDVYKYKKK